MENEKRKKKSEKVGTNKNFSLFTSHFTLSLRESEIEIIALSYLQNLGYSYLLGTEISPDGEHPERQYTDVVLVNRLRDAIDKLNPTLPQDAKEDALKKVLRTESPNAIINNEKFHRYLTDGIDVEIRTDSGIRGEKVYIIDFENPINNEFLAVNDSGIVDSFGKHSDWIELYNRGNQTVDIGGWFLTDSAKNLQRWQFPPNTLLRAGRFLLVYCDGWDGEPLVNREYHANFSLSGDGEYLALVYSDGQTVVHEFNPAFPELYTNL